MKTTYTKKRKAIREYRMFELKWKMVHLNRIPLKLKHDLFGNIGQLLQTF